MTATGLEDGAAVGAGSCRDPAALRAAGAGGLGVLERERPAVRLEPVKGASLDLESLQSLLGGGVAFATPEVQGAQAADGSRFALHDKPDPTWLTWQPAVHLGPADSGPPLPRIEVAATDVAVEDLTPASYAVQSASHVREGPGTTYRVIDTLAAGATVEVTGAVLGRDWYRIGLADGGVGYVWAKLLAPAGQAAAR